MDDRESAAVVIGDDGLARPAWAAVDPLLRDYYDTEWGMPVRDEQGLFERISLEAFQSGLSWATILRKRPAFRAAFHNFEPDAVAAFTQTDEDRLLADAGIVRNRRKIRATITNARATVALRDEGGLADFVWAFRPETTPAPRTLAEIPTRTAESEALSKALRGKGFRLRRADHDVRADGSGGHRRHAPAGESSAGHLGSVAGRGGALERPR